MKKILMTVLLVSMLLSCLTCSAWASGLNSSRISDRVHEIITRANLSSGLLSIDDALFRYSACEPKKYDIIYNPGTCGGTVTTDTDVLTYNNHYSVAALADTDVTEPYVYTFQGWSTNSAATSADIAIGTSITAWTTDGNLVLYGVCTPNTITLI